MDVGGFLMVTLDSSIADIYASPVGHDVLTMACHHAQIPTWVLQTRLMKVLKIKSLSRFTKDLDENFYQTLIQLINAEQDTPPSIDGEIKHSGKKLFSTKSIHAHLWIVMMMVLGIFKGLLIV